MKARIQGLRFENRNLVISVLPPNEVTDSKHAKLIAGFKYLLNDNSEGLINEFSDLGIRNLIELSPFILASEFIDILAANSDKGTKSYIMSEWITRFPKSDFIRHGDKNNLDHVSRAWFNDNGTSIDVQAEIISESQGYEISIQDIIEHVMTYKRGEYQKPLQFELERILIDFKHYYGFRLTPAYARFLLNLNSDRDLSLPF